MDDATVRDVQKPQRKHRRSTYLFAQVSQFFFFVLYILTKYTECKQKGERRKAKQRVDKAKRENKRKNLFNFERFVLCGAHKKS